MNMIGKIILKNLLFYWQKTAMATGLLALLFFVAFASFSFTLHIQRLADKPLSSMQTEIVLQKDHADQNPADIKTQGVILPFSLQTFDMDAVKNALISLPEIKEYSTALILWQFDIQNNKTIVAVNVGDPKVGLRKIEDWLMTGGKFFSSDYAQETILERHFATLFGYKPGESYKIEDQDYKIVGIVDFQEESNLVNAQIFLPYETALKLVPHKTPFANQVYVSLKNASLLPSVQKKVAALLPDFSVITKDRLLKNVSAFNHLIYQFGNYFVLTIVALVALLSFFIFKMHRLEFRSQTDILRTIGWPKRDILRWKLVEMCAMVSIALIISLIMLTIFNFAILPNVRSDGWLNQGFKL
jgi:cell division protein FtsX